MSSRLLITTGLALALVACGGSAAETTVVKPKPGNAYADYEPSVFDRCPVLRKCFADEDTSDCPEPVVLFQSASAKIDKRSERLLSIVVAELRRVTSIHQLQITGYSLDTEPPYVAGARATAVKDWLVKHGVDAKLLATDTVTRAGARGYAGFDARECTGDRDSTEDDGVAAAPFLLF